MFEFINVCDRFRQTKEGEDTWQRMMDTKVEINEAEFLKKCDVSRILDEDETWQDYKDNARYQGDPIKFYRTEIGLYFFQTAGFEFIFGYKKRRF